MPRETAMSTKIRLFISHSSSDTKLAERVTDLLQVALHLSSKSIRCTSVAGYRLPAGADTDERLRREVHEAEAFIGIVSAGSLRSTYVLFELGARWGANRPLIPLLAPRTPMSLLSGPLVGLNALRANNRSDLTQLVENLSEVLKITVARAVDYERAFEKVLKTKATRDQQTSEGNHWELATVSLTAADQAHRQGKDELQTKYIRKAIEELIAGDYNWEAAENLVKLSHVHDEHDRQVDRLKCLVAAAETYKLASATWESAGAYKTVAELYHDAEKRKAAARYASLAQEQYLAGNYRTEAKMCDDWITKLSRPLAKDN